MATWPRDNVYLIQYQETDRYHSEYLKLHTWLEYSTLADAESQFSNMLLNNAFPKHPIRLVCAIRCPETGRLTARAVLRYRDKTE